jgi:hypothetical protein
VIEPNEAKIVREMFEWAANGWSTIRIGKQLQAQYAAGGDRRYSLSWVLYTLHNPIYTGKISKTAARPTNYHGAHPLPGEWIDAHEPIVSWDLFAVAQKALQKERLGCRPLPHARNCSMRAMWCRDRIGSSSR